MAEFEHMASSAVKIAIEGDAALPLVPLPLNHYNDCTRQRSSSFRVRPKADATNNGGAGFSRPFPSTLKADDRE
jgi:hypothetical protein